jgi:F0F1-type ATP synthase membrane subunit c/vacuolar-type H+-ATPase subunit K
MDAIARHRSFRKTQTAMLIAAALIEGIGFMHYLLLKNSKHNSNGWL